MTNLIIVGAGGFGLEVATFAEDIAQAGGEAFTVLGFLDDTKEVGTRHGSWSVLGGTDAEIRADALYIIGLGTPAPRRALAEKLSAKGAKWAQILHPAAYIAGSARLGNGVIVAPFAYIGPEAVMKDHAFVNVHATLGHESRLGPYTVLSPYAGLMGRACAQTGVFLGAHAVVTAGHTLNEGVTLAAGAVAYSDIPAGATALGNPARWREG